MIEVGEYTMITENNITKTYTCIKIENGMAHLKDILTTRGRPKKIPVAECPYFSDNELIIPEKIVEVRPRTRSKVNITSLIKENTDLQISRSAKNFIHEWIETAVGNIISNAEKNALALGHARITAAHIHWLETNHRVEGYWKENEQYLKD